MYKIKEIYFDYKLQCICVNKNEMTKFDIACSEFSCNFKIHHYLFYRFLYSNVLLNII